MIRFVARRVEDVFDFWLWEDNGYLNDPDHWTDLLSGATNISGRIATDAVYDENHNLITPQGPWVTFNFNVGAYLTSRKNGRVTIPDNLKGKSYVIELRIDGVTYPTFSVGW